MEQALAIGTLAQDFTSSTGNANSPRGPLVGASNSERVGGFKRTRRQYGENKRGKRMKGGINREGSPDNEGYERYGKHPQSRGLSLPLSASIALAYDVAIERGIFHIEELT